MLPNRIKLSTKSTDKFRYLKSKTGLTPNILARIAMMLALKEGSNLSNAGVADNDGQDELVMVVKFKQKNLLQKGRSNVVIYELNQ